MFTDVMSEDMRPHLLNNHHQVLCQLLFQILVFVQLQLGLNKLSLGGFISPPVTQTVFDRWNIND